MAGSRVVLMSLRVASCQLSRISSYAAATGCRQNILSGSLLKRALPMCVVQSTSGFHRTAVHLNEHIFNVQDEADFEERVKKNVTPVVVDFHASWCGPCKLLGPRLESLIAGKKGKVILAKVDIDEMSDLAVLHGVEAVPTVIAMKNGKVVDQFIGLKDDVELETFLQKLID